MLKSELIDLTNEVLEDTLEQEEIQDRFVESVADTAAAIAAYVKSAEGESRKLHVMRLTFHTVRSLLKGKYTTTKGGVVLNEGSKAFKALEAVLIEAYGLLLVCNPLQRRGVLAPQSDAHSRAELGVEGVT